MYIYIYISFYMSWCYWYIISVRRKAIEHLGVDCSPYKDDKMKKNKIWKQKQSSWTYQSHWTGNQGGAGETISSHVGGIGSHSEPCIPNSKHSWKAQSTTSEVCGKRSSLGQRSAWGDQFKSVSNYRLLTANSGTCKYLFLNIYQPTTLRRVCQNC